MRARGERMGERPGDSECQRVAGDLGRRLRREAEEAPRQHVEGDERRAGDEAPARGVSHHGAEARDQAAAERGRADEAVHRLGRQRGS